jgi:hypothetical protein
MNRESLKSKYARHYSREMGNFDFQYEEITFEILLDFNNWKQNAFMDGEEKVVIFYQD